MNPAWVAHTGRLALTPIQASDLSDIAALKADPRSFAILLGGVRSPQRAREELADDIRFWGAHGFGMWTARLATDGGFVGLVGLMGRTDGLGIALRFALRADRHGRGYASEAAGAALRFGHGRGLRRIVAVAREDNTGSRGVLGGIGMRLVRRWERNGVPMLLYESLSEPWT